MVARKLRRRHNRVAVRLRKVEESQGEVIDLLAQITVRERRRAINTITRRINAEAVERSKATLETVWLLWRVAARGGSERSRRFFTGNDAENCDQGDFIMALNTKALGRNSCQESTATLFDLFSDSTSVAASEVETGGAGEPYIQQLESELRDAKASVVALEAKLNEHASVSASALIERNKCLTAIVSTLTEAAREGSQVAGGPSLAIDLPEICSRDFISELSTCRADLRRNLRSLEYCLQAAGKLIDAGVMQVDDVETVTLPQLKASLNDHNIEMDKGFVSLLDEAKLLLMDVKSKPDTEAVKEYNVLFSRPCTMYMFTQGEEGWKRLAKGAALVVTCTGARAAKFIMKDGQSRTPVVRHDIVCADRCCELMFVGGDAKVLSWMVRRSNQAGASVYSVKFGNEEDAKLFRKAFVSCSTPK
eukprot:TRINITY_DN11806_c0_g1_i2.p1 TRINITY_DN11806_c0_g1~~TRINITY_DN11806_c0_g1_i2.p1  ORF type:complete len:421 (-),score=82.07 TRINITY_DN11806_c0_g1_i2:38-1300(-)